MTRLSTGAFAVLVAATIAAFFVTQHLKVTTPLIQGSPRPVPGVIDPLHGVRCAGRNSGSTTISFYLQHRSDDVIVSVVNQAGAIVDTVATGRHMRRDVRHPDGVFHWDGREANGQVAPDGTYYFRVALLHQGRTIDLTGVPVKIKTVPPHPVVTSVQPSLIPAGPAGGTRVTIRYSGNENRGGTVLLYRTDLPGGPRLVKRFLTPWNGHTAVWDGTIRGRPAPAGTYLVGLEVSDAACNTGRFPGRVPPAPGTTPHAGVTVRYLSAQAPLDPVPAGSAVPVRVQPSGLAYRWSLERAGARRPLASGVSSAGVLRVRVPGRVSGLYSLALRSAAGRAAVPIVADASRPARVLVVLPALTWQGLNPVDDTGDGLPETLADGEAIVLDRPLVDGPPAGFADEAGLLGYLDSVHRSYELTTDLGLIRGVGRRLAGRAAVVLAGSERWLPESLSAALRAYVTAGGRVLSLGIDSLRRGVSVEGNRALNPTAPSDADALGARLGALVAVKSSPPLTVSRDDLALFGGASDVLSGFRSYQPIAPIAPPPALLTEAGAGNTVALAAYRLGAGTVIDLGVPGFGASLARDAGARQLVSRIWAVLSGS